MSHRQCKELQKQQGTEVQEIVVTDCGLKRKLDMYEVPFTVSTPAAFYTRLDTLESEEKHALVKEIHRDLARFLGVDVIETLEQDGYRALFMAVQATFTRIVKEGIIDFNKYPTKD